MHNQTDPGNQTDNRTGPQTGPAAIPSQGVYHALRLPPGTDPVAGLRDLFDQAGTRAMALVTCVGSLRRAVIRHANQPDGTVYDGHFEITALVGTLDAAGEHLHITISDGDGRAFGGHLLPGSRVYTTAEIVTVALPGLVFNRAPCPASGYDELVISPAPDTGDP